MKYLLTIIVILFSFGVFDASAQYRASDFKVERKGMYLYADDGVRITKSNALDYMNWQTYKHCYLPGKRLFNAGRAISSIGGAVFTFFIIIHAYNMSTWNPDLMGSGTIYPLDIWGAGIGLGFAALSIPLFASGVVLLFRSAERCNSGIISSHEVTFGPLSSGIGVGIRFCQ